MPPEPAAAPAPPPADGVLLVNLGTPESPTPPAVRRYLGAFLADPYVIDIPAPLRWLLLHGWILRTRPQRVAPAYASIWTERGSPLRFHSEDLAAGLAQRLPVPVALGMRYGNPGIAAGLDRLVAAGAGRIRVLLLFPQYSESAWETAAVVVRREVAARGLRADFVPPFYADPGFLDALAQVARPVLREFQPDRVLASFHGLPERHIHRTDRGSPPRCLVAEGCCDAMVEANRDCYRAQCYATARGLATRLELAEGSWEVAFQSRLGRTPWIQPFTDQRLTALAAAGCRRLAVVCPSFVADCLETLEEIQIRARDSFRAAGGEDLRLVPCLNSADPWVDAAAALVRPLA